MAPSAFRLFTANAQGSGPSAALNQDSSVNSANNPAAPGSVVQLFGAGGGAVTPAFLDGHLAPLSPLSWLTSPFSATINGENATITYAGASPGLVFGVYQINVQLPTDTAAGAANLFVTVGTTQSQSNVTVFVR
jgi:uncharacterized protein (TIGR03437 family)